MPESLYQHLECSIIVLHIRDAQLQGIPISDALRTDLLGAAECSGARHVVLDFQNVAYMSSVAFRPLLSLHRKLKEKGGRLVLCGMTERVAEVFSVTRLIRSNSSGPAPFESQADVPAAVASLYPQPPVKPA